MFLLALGCVAEPDSSPAPVLPGHNDCLAEGESFSAEVCSGVVAEQGRVATVSENKSGDAQDATDARQFDPELAWVTGEVTRCACACCHTQRYGGAGVYAWDLDWNPVWSDSASGWSLSVFAGYTSEPDQTLPTADLARLRAWVDAEIDRRDTLSM